MENKPIHVKKAGKQELAHTDLAIKLKWMLNDIIDVVYKNNVSEQVLRKLKRFTIFATETEFNSKLGDCWHNKDGSASIRILGLGRDRNEEILVLAIHEVSHHVEHCLYGDSGHSARYYEIHKKLLFAAFDMGILRVEDLTTESESRLRNSEKVAKMMKDYVPHPINYKEDIVHIFVYNAYAIKDQLKANGYKWNSLDTAWTKDFHISEAPKEYAFLGSLNVPPDNVRETRGGAVVTRLRKNAKLFNVRPENREMVKRLGFRWVDAGKERYWKKLLDGDDLPAEERAELEKAIGKYNIRID